MENCTSTVIAEPIASIEILSILNLLASAFLESKTYTVFCLIIAIHSMTDIAFILVRRFAVPEVSLSAATRADTWLHHTELGLASNETESEST